MPVEMPPVSSNLDDPLPQVDPNSQLVPYRTGRKDPGGQYVVTTGYAPRVRPPIQPPGGVGAGAPDLSQGITQAFQNLPVDQASKAIEAAIRYQAQRGYMRDLQSGSNAAQAFAKWGPMLFHQATGIPEAIDRSVPTPLSQMQQYQIQRNKPLDESVIADRKAKQELATAKLEFEKQKAAKSTTVEAGPVQGQPVLDPETKKPIEGLIATPSAGGKGMTVRLTPKAQSELTPSAAAEYFKAAPEIDRNTGVNPKAPGSFTRRMATNMVDIATRKTEKKDVPNPAQTQKPLTKEIAAEFKKQAGGDLEKARKLARDAGYQF